MTLTDRPDSSDAPTTPRRRLAAAVLTSLLASICCVGPLLLVFLGIGGAWVTDLTALDPIRPWLTAAMVTLLSLVHDRYWQLRRALACDYPPPRSQALWLWLAGHASCQPKLGR